MVKIDTHELAWAAGFFDGEGTISSRTQRGNKGNGACISVSQIRREPLDRFKIAVLNLGTVYGPYKQKHPNSNPYFVWSTTKHEHVQAVIAALWKFLGPHKRQQIAKALENVNLPHRKPGPKPKGTTCV